MLLAAYSFAAILVCFAAIPTLIALWAALHDLYLMFKGEE